ncbi:hypothetical protein HP15_552 [Marinobacter adhaerens HP15]|uniref:Uncharacterized protein n=1 Tax=Marinobacter adhaerens (strain DSM 23420 / HP15) TaxID=225937 RepID=E4PNJ9_MARAH|nr:hypothetical protein HP15_552 [Marinobacter adhaerens HP15]
MVALVLEPAGDPEEVGLGGLYIIFVAGKLEGLVGRLRDVGFEIDGGAARRQKGGSKHAGQGSLMNTDI